MIDNTRDIELLSGAWALFCDAFNSHANEDGRTLAQHAADLAEQRDREREIAIVRTRERDEEKRLHEAMRRQRDAVSANLDIMRRERDLAVEVIRALREKVEARRAERHGLCPPAHVLDWVLSEIDALSPSPAAEPKKPDHEQ